MSLTSRLVSRLLDLPPAQTEDVVVERNLPVPMPDGAVLLADHYFPRDSSRLPTVLIRCPYGRAGLMAAILARPFAERGFQVLIQSVRGTFGSGGDFTPYRDERADGLATLAWIRQQPWYSGQLATVGPSYLGLVQWAIAAEAGPELQAMAVQVSCSDFRRLTFPGESFSLDTTLTWIHLLSHQEESLFAALLSQIQSPRALRPAFQQLPLARADEAAVGRAVPFFRDWLEHAAPDDPWWEPVDFSRSLAQVNAPVFLLGGWYDIFLPSQLDDYARLRQAGHRPYLTIGPWTHAAPGSLSVAVRESLAWLRAHLLGDPTGLRQAPVRVYVMGANRWKEFADWPPAEYREQRWHLHPDGGLERARPVESELDRYHYDPADPTPAVGGASLSTNSGPKDQRTLEARPDVLTYTSAALDRAVEVVGPVSAEIWFRSSLAYTDLFVRLCDVDPAGRSINLCDGLLRLAPGRPEPESDGTLRVCLGLWPTAHRFRPGHRIRLQVSSGSHPRFSRNPGSGEPLGTATTLVAADQAVYHDPAHPSAVLLPVLR